MRFILVIDDNGPEFVDNADPRMEIADVVEAAVLRLRRGDRSGALFVEDSYRPIGGFELTLGKTEGRPGWERTR